jgi:hypothetical protein
LILIIKVVKVKFNVLDKYYPFITKANNKRPSWSNLFTQGSSEVSQGSEVELEAEKEIGEAHFPVFSGVALRISNLESTIVEVHVSIDLSLLSELEFVE